MTYFGLTGGAGTGKSTTARLLAELGAHIIDADRIGHDLLLPSSPAFPDVVRRFGREILSASGEIERSKLGARVFAAAAELAALNALVHPEIIRRVEESAVRTAAAEPGAVIVVDAALILEAGIGGRCFKLIVTWCRPEQQLERLMSNLRLTRAEAERRIAAQISADEKRRRADFVIDTSGSQEETGRQVRELYPQLRQLALSAR